MNEAVVEYMLRDMSGGSFWIDVVVDRERWGSIGPFETETERQRALDDLLSMTRELGAKDLPLKEQ